MKLSKDHLETAFVIAWDGFWIIFGLALVLSVARAFFIVFIGG